MPADHETDTVRVKKARDRQAAARRKARREENEYWRKRADAGHKLLLSDPSVDPWEVLAAIVWPTPALEAAFETL